MLDYEKNNIDILYLLDKKMDLHQWGKKKNIVSKKYHYVENSSANSAIMSKTIV